MKTIMEINGKRYKVVPDKPGVYSCAANGCALQDLCYPDEDILCKDFITCRAVHFEEDGNTTQA